MHRVAIVICVAWALFVSGAMGWDYLKSREQAAPLNVEPAVNVALETMPNTADPA